MVIYITKACYWEGHRIQLQWLVLGAGPNHHTGLGRAQEQGQMFSTMLQSQLDDRVTSSRKSPLTDISW